MTKAHDDYRRFLETLTQDSLSELSQYVAEDVRFKDPFNDVRGRAAFEHVLRHMFEALGDIRFQVEHSMSDGVYCLMQWRFATKLRGADWVVDGTSRITFDRDGKVVEHIDYWDAAENLYERLPVIGWLLALLRGRLAVR